MKLNNIPLVIALFLITTFSFSCFSDEFKEGFVDGVSTAMKQETAIRYNNFLVDGIDTCVTAVLDVEDEFYVGSYEEAKEVYDYNYERILTQYEMVSSTDAFDENEAIKKAALEWMAFYIGLMEEDFVKILDILNREEITENDELLIDDIINASFDDEYPLKAQFDCIQDIYAEKYDFMIEPTYDESLYQ